MYKCGGHLEYLGMCDLGVWVRVVWVPGYEAAFVDLAPWYELLLGTRLLLWFRCLGTSCLGVWVRVV